MCLLMLVFQVCILIEANDFLFYLEINQQTNSSSSFCIYILPSNICILTSKVCPL